MSDPELRRSASVEIQAPPLVVYDTVRRLERMGEWSPEATGGRWVEGDGTRV
nr:SRPBCC family protein [Actinomycetota bacterium]NIW28633.1 SRPBCC family protein [Actinomycetota bacterium]